MLHAVGFLLLRLRACTALSCGALMIYLTSKLRLIGSSSENEIDALLSFMLVKILTYVYNLFVLLIKRALQALENKL